MSSAHTIYLDHAATTPLDSAVFLSMQPYLTEAFYNPSATYSAARKVKQAITEARRSIAHHVGARPTEIIFTAGGTEANNLLIHGIMRQFPDGNCVVSAIEHDSVLHPAAQYNQRVAGVLSDGRIDIAALKTAIDDQTVLVSIQYANNEIGTIQPLRDIARLIGDVKQSRLKVGNTRPLYFHTDACQVPVYLDIHAARLGVDAMTVNASKIYGPKQVGALFVKSGVHLEPMLLGGGQEKGMRSGTENVAGIIGFAEALNRAQIERHEESKRLQMLRAQFIEAIQSRIPTAVINGSIKHRLPNNVHITLPGQDNELLMMRLDKHGILCAVGSACSASDEEPSHVLKAIGLSDEAAHASLRFSMGRSTNKAAIQRTVEALANSLG
jgi:cysteine desulfurase